MAANPQLVNWLQQAGFKGQGLNTMLAIVQAESGGNPRAFNGNANTGDKSYGLSQINMLGALGPARLKQYGLSSNEDLFDPLTNLKVAYRMSGGGQNFSPWSTYKTGAYKKYLGSGAATSPAGSPAGAAVLPPSGPPPNIFADAIRSGEWRIGSSLADTVRLVLSARQGINPLETALSTAAKAGKSTEGGLQLPKAGSWKGTHVTDGLGWGTGSAEDIMGKPGTPVLAPEAGTVVYFHPKGAQGGGSMLIRTKSGREYWLGHIADGVKAGTQIRRGQRIASISGDHPRPHVHIDYRGK